jgi:hypothetical protein
LLRVVQPPLEVNPTYNTRLLAGTIPMTTIMMMMELGTSPLQPLAQALVLLVEPLP